MKEIPVPEEGYPYIGHLLALGNHPSHQVRLWHQKLGPIFGLHMGIKNWIFINDPELAHNVLATNGAYASNRDYNTFGHKYYSIHGRGVLFAQPEGKLKSSRYAASQILAPKEIDKLIHVIFKEADILVDRLIEATESEGSVYPKKYTSISSLNVIHEAIFGTRFDRVDDSEFLEKLNQSDEMLFLSGLEHNMAGFLPILSIYSYFFGSEKKMINLVRRRDRVYGKSMKEALESKEHNLVKQLVAEDFDKDDLLVISSDLVIGGADTTAIALQWIIALLCHYPDIQDRARREIDEFVNKYQRLPTFQERNETPYTFAMLRECMRYKEVTPFGTPHLTTKDIEVDGYLIPKGVSVATSMEALHFNPDNYSDPEKFIPERFLGFEKSMMASAQGSIQERDHYIFGWGRRLCPGIYLTENELYVFVSKMLHRCIIQPHGELPDIRVVPQGILAPPLPYQVRINRRSTSNDML
ncbi:cytochrome P450 [Pilobolus umbonatus]|nr:cytochrome P450 [Pilobolus umbonatus]